MLKSLRHFPFFPSSTLFRTSICCNSTEYSHSDYYWKYCEEQLAHLKKIKKNMDSTKTGGIITLVTGNVNKLKEIRTILGDSFQYELVINDADLPEYQGDADTVSKLKCQSAYSIIRGPVIVEDTCLGFNALNGLPGPYIKWFLKSIRPEGLYKLLAGFEDKGAKAMATLAYCDSDNGEVLLFKGITEGTIVSPKGQGGFGWDTCFLPIGFDKTYAEMSADEKNLISHRKKAVEAMRDYFMTATPHHCKKC